eukprot:10142309-Alexandrium_andersonii.AAC.1
MPGPPTEVWPAHPGSAANRGMSTRAEAGGAVHEATGPWRAPGGGDAGVHHGQCHARPACPRRRPGAANIRTTW